MLRPWQDPGEGQAPACCSEEGHGRAGRELSSHDLGVTGNHKLREATVNVAEPQRKPGLRGRLGGCRSGPPCESEGWREMWPCVLGWAGPRQGTDSPCKDPKAKVLAIHWFRRRPSAENSR